MDRKAVRGWLADSESGEECRRFRIFAMSLGDSSLFAGGLPGLVVGEP